jgi:hypothetical protein
MVLLFSCRSLFSGCGFLPPLSDSYAKVQRIYNPIFAKNIFKDAFFAKLLSLILTV